MVRVEFTLFSVCSTLMLLFTSVRSCNLGGIQVCMYHMDIVNPIDILKFIPQSEFEETCRRKTVALKCALRDEIVSGCEYSVVVSLRVQNNVRKAVCEDMADAYKSSSECFGQDGLEDEILGCVNAFEQERYEKCPAMEYARSCVADAFQAYDACNEQDKELMSKLVDKYLRPFALPEKYDCDIPDLLEEDDNEEEETATNDPVTTSFNTTSTPNSTTTTTSSSTTTTTDGNGAAPAGHSFSAFLHVVLFMIMMHVKSAYIF